MKKKILIGIGITLLVIIVTIVAAFYPAIRSMMHTDIVAVDPGLTLVLGGGGNSGIIAGDSAIVVIDTKMMSNAEALFTLAKEAAGTKPIIVINTHYHGDHVGGNKYFKGSRIYTGNYEKEYLLKNIDAENQPTDIVRDSMRFDLGKESVSLYVLGRAHTFSDMVVYLPGRKMLFTGDLIFNGVHPVLKAESGAKVSEWIKVLDVILSRWGDCTIVPGHGAVGDRTMAATMRQYFVDMMTAAKEPGREKQLTTTYKDWMSLPTMSSADKTIEYIKMSENRK